MGTYTLLQRRPTGYYFRQIVPEDLQIILGKKEIVKSLKTNDLKEATRKQKTLAAEIDSLFHRIRSGDTSEVNWANLSAPTIKPSINPIRIDINATERGRGKTLKDVYELWAADIDNYKTKQTMELALERFEAASTTRLIGAIDSGHIVDFKDWLTNNFNWRGRTVNKHIDAIKSLVSCAHSNNWIRANPLYGLKVKASEKNSESYLPFEPDELKRLFLNNHFAKLRKDIHIPRTYGTAIHRQRSRSYL